MDGRLVGWLVRAVRPEQLFPCFFSFLSSAVASCASSSPRQTKPPALGGHPLVGIEIRSLDDEMVQPASPTRDDELRRGIKRKEEHMTNNQVRPTA